MRTHPLKNSGKLRIAYREKRYSRWLQEASPSRCFQHVLIAVTQRGAPELTAQELTALIEQNPHGAGIAWVANGRVCLWRELETTADRIASVLRWVPDDSPCLLHLRQATCGAVTLDQVQPLTVKGVPGLLFAHNGTFPGFGDSVTSDSQQFVQEIISPSLMRVSAEGASQGFGDLAVQVPEGNRVVLFDRRGAFEIIHREEGFSHRNMWLSNRKMAKYLSSGGDALASIREAA